MIFFYFLIFLLCILAELSPKINTRNVLGKLFIGMVAIGALISMAGKDTIFIELGITGYITVSIYQFLVKRGY